VKGGFVNIERKFFRIFRRTKLTVLLAFTVAGDNLDRIRSFLARAAERASSRPRSTKRRRGTFDKLIGDSVRPRGPDPA
jgi:hypothetical protein